MAPGARVDKASANFFMAKKLFHVALTQKEIILPPEEEDAGKGARITFAGIVRGSENDRPIEGIRYSAYEPMAESELLRIARESRESFPGHDLWVEHRLGTVPAGQPSLYIMVATPHSKEGFEIMTWCLHAVKTRVPIWKEPLYLDPEESSSKSEIASQ